MDTEKEEVTSNNVKPVQAISFQLSDEQKGFIDAALIDRANILLLGKAGVGKSTAVRLLCEEADKRGLSYARTAPTGKAAINIGGETVHRLISKLSGRWGRDMANLQLDFILIDEVSMVRADLLDELSSMLKNKMMSDKPFGGVQIILVGDPGQLPPVVNDREKGEVQYLEAHYLSHHFFGANSFFKVPWRIIELTKIFRQKDDRFPKLLNLIREGKREKPLAYLNKFRTTTEPKGVILTGRNADADAINRVQLAKLNTPGRTYTAWIEGEIDRRDWPADFELELKIDARVMVIKNIYSGEDPESTTLELINGDTGTVLDFDEDSVTISCDRTEREHIVPTVVWGKKESVFNEETKRLEYIEKGRFAQVPLRLAWAVTIHKAQGATIEEVTIDYRKPMFAAGQSYVALSRGVSLDRVWILGRIRPRDIQVDETVADFLAEQLSSKFVGVKKDSQFDIEDVSVATTEQIEEAFDDMFGE